MRYDDPAKGRASPAGPRRAAPPRSVPVTTNAAYVRGALDARLVLGLQRDAGNGAVAAWVARPALQRTALDSIAQPAATERDATVPDLTSALVQRIRNAIPAARQGVLDDLLAYLRPKLGFLAATDPAATDLDKATIEVVYVDAPNGPSFAVTQGFPDVNLVRITVYPKAFASGPAGLYSTLRHEIIHAAQVTGAPDPTAAQATDQFVYEDKTGTDWDIQSVQIPMQEIETHVWELTHAAETGVPEAGQYFGQTVTALTSYANTLAREIHQMVAIADNKKRRKALSQQQAEDRRQRLRYWKGYLSKSVTYLRTAATAIGHPQRKAAVAAAAGRLSAAITALDPPAPVIVPLPVARPGRGQKRKAGTG